MNNFEIANGAAAAKAIFADFSQVTVARGEPQNNVLIRNAALPHELVMQAANDSMEYAAKLRGVYVDVLEWELKQLKALV